MFRRRTPSRTRSARTCAGGDSLRGLHDLYAFMQAVGMVNDHPLDCFRHREVARLARPARSEVMRFRRQLAERHLSKRQLPGGHAACHSGCPSARGIPHRLAQPRGSSRLARRLSWLALIYSLTYIAVEGTVLTHKHVEGVHSWTEHLLNIIPITIGFLVAWAARAGKISPRMFPKVLIVFQLVSTIGIILGMWGWETRVAPAEGDRRHWRHRSRPVPGAAPGTWDFADQLGGSELDRRVASDRAFRASSFSASDGVRIPRRALRSFRSTAGSRACARGSAGNRTVAGRLMFDLSIPVFICAGIAILGSRVVYGLTRQLSDARQMGSYGLEESSARAAWARCGGRGTGCWLGPRPSS